MQKQKNYLQMVLVGLFLLGLPLYFIFIQSWRTVSPTGESCSALLWEKLGVCL